MPEATVQHKYTLFQRFHPSRSRAHADRHRKLATHRQTQSQSQSEKCARCMSVISLTHILPVGESNKYIYVYYIYMKICLIVTE